MTKRQLQTTIKTLNECLKELQNDYIKSFDFKYLTKEELNDYQTNTLDMCSDIAKATGIMQSKLNELNEL